MLSESNPSVKLSLKASSIGVIADTLSVHIFTFALYFFYHICCNCQRYNSLARTMPKTKLNMKTPTDILAIIFPALIFELAFSISSFSDGGRISDISGSIAEFAFDIAPSENIKLHIMPHKNDDIIKEHNVLCSFLVVFDLIIIVRMYYKPIVLRFTVDRLAAARAKNGYIRYDFSTFGTYHGVSPLYNNVIVVIDISMTHRHNRYIAKKIVHCGCATAVALCTSFAPIIYRDSCGRWH